MAARTRRTAGAGDASVDADEVDRFDALARQWWDPEGPMRPLHRLNPLRLAFLRDRLTSHFDLNPEGRHPLVGLRLVDVGCGAGLLSEPLARLGAEVTAIDVSAENIAVARQHARVAGLAIDYRESSAEALVRAGRGFDAVVSMEVVEHVADLAGFLDACGALVRPGGAAAFATLNRTAKSYATAILGAEYLLGWLPRGTHRFDRFVKPAELRRHLARAGLRLDECRGVSFHPWARDWRFSADRSVNYLAFAVKD
jgi:2-polyprenyl-6-hydroxyphenyl methylase / 3-demethylubiquinone-9 3-methyltransferase